MVNLRTQTNEQLLIDFHWLTCSTGIITPTILSVQCYDIEYIHSVVQVVTLGLCFVFKWIFESGSKSLSTTSVFLGSNGCYTMGNVSSMQCPFPVPLPGAHVSS